MCILMLHRIAIMINVGGNLVTPNLMPGQELTALNLKEVTSTSKYVYLVPSRDLNSPARADYDTVSYMLLAYLLEINDIYMRLCV